MTDRHSAGMVYLPREGGRRRLHSESEPVEFAGTAACNRNLILALDRPADPADPLTVGLLCRTEACKLARRHR